MPTFLALGLWLAAQTAPQEPPVTTGTDRGSAVRLQLSGHLDLHYLDRSPAIEDAGAVLNGLAPGAGGAGNLWSGRIRLRTEIQLKDLVSGVVELENRSFEKGINKPFGASPPDTPLQIKQGYVEAGDFLSPQLSLRIGVQNVTFRNRPQDEPFFMDLGESESFWGGFRPGGGFVSNSVDRDITQPVGMRVFYSPAEVATLQAFWMVVQEQGGTSQDESVTGIVANSLLAEQWSAWLMVVGVSGGGDRRGVLGTLGAGLDGYLGDAKQLELFVEGYGQGGTLQHAPGAVHKRAYAFNAGARWMACCDNKLWVEAALSRRSGDRRAGDDHDQAFQSYENVNRFLILESGEFGLDVDTNVSAARAAVGVGPFDLDGRPLRIRLDVGRFAAVTPIPTAGKSRQWGVESDLSFVWDYNESFALSLKGAWLADSDLLRILGGENHALLLVFGADLRF